MEPIKSENESLRKMIEDQMNQMKHLNDKCDRSIERTTKTNSSGHDNLNSKLFKLLGQSITNPISIIINKSIALSLKPLNWLKSYLSIKENLRMNLQSMDLFLYCLSCQKLQRRSSINDYHF